MSYRTPSSSMMASGRTGTPIRDGFRRLRAAGVVGPPLQVAAARRALVYFGEGMDAIGVEFGDGWTYMGTDRDEHNQKADANINSLNSQ